jgi:hypothetical protein
MVRRGEVTTTLEFLEISKQKWATIIEHSIRKTIEGLAYMNRIRFSLSSQHKNFDTDDPTALAANQEKRNS